MLVFELPGTRSRPKRLQALMVFSENVGTMRVCIQRTTGVKPPMGWDENGVNSAYYGQVVIAGPW